MKLIATLIKNEYIKLFKKKSVPILLLLLVLFIFGISLIKPYDYSYSRSYYSSPAYFENRKMQYKSYAENSVYDFYGDTEDLSDEIKTVLDEFYKKQVELCDKAIALIGDSENDWRISAINELLNVNSMQYLADYASENGEYADEVKAFLNKYKDYMYDNDRYLSYSAHLKAIEENDYSESKRYLYNTAVQTSDTLKAQLDELKSKQEKGTGGSDIDFKIYKAEGIYANSERIVRAYKAALDKKIEYNSVQDKTLGYTVNALRSAMNGYDIILSKDEYQKNKENDINYINADYYYYGYNSIESYEDYLENVKKSIETYEQKGLVGLYALENDVTEMTVADSSRSKSLSFVNLFWFIAPLAIYFASSMVSQEFSTKTINLLLIRPVKRWKILLSKYICIITLTFGMVAVCAAAYLLGTGINLGFTDFSEPYIYVASGEAHAASFIPWFLWKIFVAAVPVFCLVNLTFMFSTVTKGTAVSLILGVLSLFSSILILFFTGLFENPNVITYMPFPYFSMWSYVLDDVIYLNSSNTNIFSYIIKADLTYGFIILLGLIILSVVLAFADFTKKDIK